MATKKSLSILNSFGFKVKLIILIILGEIFFSFMYCVKCDLFKSISIVFSNFLLVGNFLKIIEYVFFQLINFIIINIKIKFGVFSQIIKEYICMQKNSHFDFQFHLKNLDA